MRKIYLDYNASTPIAPEVAAAMREAMGNAFGNPSSTHWAGAPAHRIVETARGQVAELLGCESHEVVFTSGGSEANNFALKGAFFASKRSRRHFITTSVEHPAILAPLRFLQTLGATVTLLPVDATGRINPDDLRRAIMPGTILISIMHANNEVGTIQPIEECSAIAREHGIPFHTDAAQSIGKIPTRVDNLGVDLLAIAGHKLYAPKGVGALYIRNGIDLAPLIYGGGTKAAGAPVLRAPCSARPSARPAPSRATCRQCMRSRPCATVSGQRSRSVSEKALASTGMPNTDCRIR